MTIPSYSLTRSLGFNAYHVFAASSAEQLKDHVGELNRRYDASFYQQLLSEVADLIGARVLNVSTETYHPPGISVAMLMEDLGEIAENTGNLITLGHLDKSHLTIHTYQQIDLETLSGHLRLDLDLGSCGEITPLKATNHLLKNLLCDVVTIDYRIRGYQQQQNQSPVDTGRPINPASHISSAWLDKYHIQESDHPEIDFYHLRMIKQEKFFTSIREQKNLSTHVRERMMRLGRAIFEIEKQEGA